jgi:hypothetical protein
MTDRQQTPQRAQLGLVRALSRDSASHDQAGQAACLTSWSSCLLEGPKKLPFHTRQYLPGLHPTARQWGMQSGTGTSLVIQACDPERQRVVQSLPDCPGLMAGLHAPPAASGMKRTVSQPNP